MIITLYIGFSTFYKPVGNFVMSIGYPPTHRNFDETRRGKVEGNNDLAYKRTIKLTQICALLTTCLRSLAKT
jgi:hypothetical protein